MVRKAGTPEQEAEVQRLTAELAGSVVQAKPGLGTKMVAIMGALEGMKPEGQNRHFSYDYWTADQIAAKFRSLFVKHGLCFMADVIDYETREKGKGFLTTVKVLFTITDTTTGETISGHGVGQGDDTQDKGSNKAMAGALKYWLLKTFLMGGEDAEADEATDRRSEGRSRDVVVEDSRIEGIERGGRSTRATEVQVKRVRTLSRELGYGINRMAELIEDVLMVRFDIPDDPDDRAPAFVRFLGDALTADEIGKLIVYMEKMRPDEE